MAMALIKLGDVFKQLLVDALAPNAGEELKKTGEYLRDTVRAGVAEQSGPAMRNRSSEPLVEVVETDGEENG